MGMKFLTQEHTYECKHGKIQALQYGGDPITGDTHWAYYVNEKLMRTNLADKPRSSINKWITDLGGLVSRTSRTNGTVYHCNNGTVYKYRIQKDNEPAVYKVVSSSYISNGEDVFTNKGSKLPPYKVVDNAIKRLGGLKYKTNRIV